MTDTDSLIDVLAARAAPVAPLASPLRRTVLWVLFAVAIAGAIVALHGARPGWLQDLQSPAAAIEWIASIVTGVLAAYALFHISVPGRSPSWAWLPLPAALAWLGGIGLGCIGDLHRVGADAFAFELGSWECAGVITATSLPLGFVLLMMVRHAGVVRPAPAAMLAALSAAAFSAASVSLYHEGENALMTLLWHVGAVAVLSASSWVCGRSLFAWIGYARRGSV